MGGNRGEQDMGWFRRVLEQGRSITRWHAMAYTVLSRRFPPPEALHQALLEDQVLRTAFSERPWTLLGHSPHADRIRGKVEAVRRRMTRHVPDALPLREDLIASPAKADDLAIADPPADLDHDPAVDDLAEEGVVAAWVYDCLIDFPEKARSTVMLRIVEGLTFRQIGEELGIKEGTARSYYHKALKVLARKAVDDGRTAFDGRFENLRKPFAGEEESFTE